MKDTVNAEFVSHSLAIGLPIVCHMLATHLPLACNPLAFTTLDFDCALFLTFFAMGGVVNEHIHEKSLCSSSQNKVANSLTKIRLSRNVDAAPASIDED